MCLITTPTQIICKLVACVLPEGSILKPLIFILNTSVFYRDSCARAVKKGQLGTEKLHCGFVQTNFNRGLQIKKIQNPSLLWKWVGGFRSQSEFFLENHPKIALNQY